MCGMYSHKNSYRLSFLIELSYKLAPKALPMFKPRIGGTKISTTVSGVRDNLLSLIAKGMRKEKRAEV